MFRIHWGRWKFLPCGICYVMEACLNHITIIVLQRILYSSPWPKPVVHGNLPTELDIKENARSTVTLSSCYPSPVKQQSMRLNTLFSNTMLRCSRQGVIFEHEAQLNPLTSKLPHPLVCLYCVNLTDFTFSKCNATCFFIFQIPIFQVLSVCFCMLQYEWQTLGRKVSCNWLRRSLPPQLAGNSIYVPLLNPVQLERIPVL